MDIKIESNWIKVADRLPEPENWAIVFANDHVNMMWYGLSNNGTMKWFYQGDIAKSYMRPTHWMPIPQPPKI